jgi:hypothetical protein
MDVDVGRSHFLSFRLEGKILFLNLRRLSVTLGEGFLTYVRNDRHISERFAQF